MDHKQQKTFIANLRRPQLNQLCLELQAMVTNFKTYLAETHGYTTEEVEKIMFGTKYEDLDTTIGKSPASSAEKNTKPNQGDTRMANSFVQPNPADLARLKREDEIERRALMFELEWCVAQIEQGNFPH